MTFKKTLAAFALAGLVTLATVVPSSAQNWRPWAAAGAGLAAGAVIGSTIAGAATGYYGPGYYGAYGYAPGYDSYAAAPYGGVTFGPYYRSGGQFGHYDSGFKSCATDGDYNRTNYSAC